MSIIGFLLLVFIIFIIVSIILPIAKLALGVWRARRNWNEAMNRFRNATANGENAPGADNNPATKRRKKKIDSDVGEYVAFEEIKVETGQNNARKPGPTVVEEQIEDISWEDIK